MGHDALVGLPALPGDELEHRSRLTGAEEQVEELIDERTIRRQRIPGKDQTSDPLDQAAFVADADALDGDGLRRLWVASGIFERQHAAEGDAADDRPFQAIRVDELAEVLDQVAQTEAAAKRELVGFASQLIRDDVEFLGQLTCQRSEEVVSSGKPRNEQQRSSVAPFAKMGVVVREVERPRHAHPWLERRSRCWNTTFRWRSRGPS